MKKLLTLFLIMLFIGSSSFINAESITEDDQKHFKILISENKIDDVRNNLEAYKNDEGNLKKLLSRTLLVAIENNNSEMVRLLLEYHADPNEKGDNHRNCLHDQHTTPLHLAALKGSSEIIQILLNADADPNAYDLFLDRAIDRYQIVEDNSSSYKECIKKLESITTAKKASSKERRLAWRLNDSENGIFFPKTIINSAFLSPAGIITSSLILFIGLAVSDYHEEKEISKEKKDQEVTQQNSKEKKDEQDFIQEKNNLKENVNTITIEHTDFKKNNREVTIANLLYAIKNPKKHKIFYTGLTGIMYCISNMYSENSTNKKILKDFAR